MGAPGLQGCPHCFGNLFSLKCFRQSREPTGSSRRKLWAETQNSSVHSFIHSFMSGRYGGRDHAGSRLLLASESC